MSKLKIKDSKLKIQNPESLICNFQSSINKGFTLMELMVVIAIIVLLAGIMTPNVAKRLERAKMTRAEADIAAIEGAIAMYENDTGRYPESRNTNWGGYESVDVLARRLTGRTKIGGVDTDITDDSKWHGPYIKGIEQDSWKKDYVYIKNMCPRPVGSPPCAPSSTGYPVVVGNNPFDYPAHNYGGSVDAPQNLSYYIFSRGKNKNTGLVSAGDNEDDINNWDIKTSWREKY